MTSTNFDYPHKYKEALALADEIVQKAIEFAARQPVDPQFDRNLLVAQHVKVQLAYLSDPTSPNDVDPGPQCLLAHHLGRIAEDGVRVHLEKNEDSV